MAVEVSTYVWTHSQEKGSSLLMLLALADYSNLSGESYPGVDSIAFKTRMTPRNAQILLGKLRSKNIITIDENAGVKTATGWTNRYTIIGFKEWYQEVKGISPLGQGVKNSVSRGEMDFTPGVKNSAKVSGKGVKGVSPKPLFKPSVESVKEPKDSASSDAAQNVPVFTPPQIPDSPVGEKTTAAKKKSTASATPEENKAVAEIIKSWLDASGMIQANAYGNKTNRALAMQMHQKGVTPADVNTLIKDLRDDDFWKDKPISLTKVAERIVAWKEAAQHIPPEHKPWVPPPERTDYVDPQIVLMQNKQMAKMLRLQRNAAVVPNG